MKTIKVFLIIIWSFAWLEKKQQEKTEIDSKLDDGILYR